jgi:hypothetical protein
MSSRVSHHHRAHHPAAHAPVKQNSCKGICWAVVGAVFAASALYWGYEALESGDLSEAWNTISIDEFKVLASVSDLSTKVAEMVGTPERFEIFKNLMAKKCVDEARAYAWLSAASGLSAIWPIRNSCYHLFPREGLKRCLKKTTAFVGQSYGSVSRLGSRIVLSCKDEVIARANETVQNFGAIYTAMKTEVVTLVTKLTRRATTRTASESIKRRPYLCSELRDFQAEIKRTTGAEISLASTLRRRKKQQI